MGGLLGSLGRDVVVGVSVARWSVRVLERRRLRGNTSRAGERRRRRRSGRRRAPRWPRARTGASGRRRSGRAAGGGQRGCVAGQLAAGVVGALGRWPIRWVPDTRFGV